MARNWSQQLKQLIVKRMDLPEDVHDGPSTNYNDWTNTYIY